MTEITVATSLTAIREALSEGRAALDRTGGVDYDIDQIERALNYADIAADNLSRLGQRMAVVEEFLAERAEFVTTLRQCIDDNADYYRWQGHAEARRVLSERLGFPVAWPAEDSRQDGAVSS